jgi:Response regulators consisting of a CheY-like receiver domain and a winged-helix DNA-binding domain
MKVLIAEDDASSRMMLASLLTKWGYTVILACDGNEAWRILSEPEHPHVVILDWIMPGIEGPEIVQLLREREPGQLYYAIIITTRGTKDSAVSAMDRGADDFVGKPFDIAELRARIAVGCRINGLQNALSEHLQKLEDTLARVKQLEGIIPICMYCKKIRDDHNSWNQLEQYISGHSEAEFSHGICPRCAEEQQAIITKLSRSMQGSDNRTR